MSRGQDGHVYRLALTADGHNEAREIEFEAKGSDMALGRTHKFSGSRSVTMFEDGQKLADLKYDRGFWIVSRQSPRLSDRPAPGEVDDRQ